MDYDLAIFTNITMGDIGKKLHPALELSEYSGKLKIFKAYSDYSGSLQDVIFDFLQVISLFRGEIFAQDTLLQIGVYYPAEDFISFSVKLSKKCISELSEKNIGRVLPRFHGHI